jgi:hypothetical protein
MKTLLPANMDEKWLRYNTAKLSHFHFIVFVRSAAAVAADAYCFYPFIFVEVVL